MMRATFLALLVLLGVEPSRATQWADLPLFNHQTAPPAGVDWLVKPVPRKARIYRTDHRGEIVLDNGLIRRMFRLTPNGATVGLDNLMTGSSVMRGVKPEALVTLDGRDFKVGGLTGQPDYAYLAPRWIDRLKADPDAFQCTGFDIGRTRAPFPWHARRHAGNTVWPPPGVSLTLHYRAPHHLYRGLGLDVHYELYDGLPVYCKWITLTNGSDRAVTLNRFTSDLLAAVETESIVDGIDPKDWRVPNLTVVSDYSFHGGDLASGHPTTQWLPDPQYTSQVNYKRETPVLMVSRPPLGPDLLLMPGSRFASFRTYVLVHDGFSRERHGLAIRKLYRAMAPWVTENPIMMHLTRSDRASFRKAVDQCAAVGFEMVIFSFGSGLNMENEDPAYLARIKADVEYAHSKGIEVGAYSLLASRRIDPADDVICPTNGQPDGCAIFGSSPCLGSRWGLDYFKKIKHFIKVTGLDLLEHDGSYPGDLCASTHHPGHRGLLDSQWKQWRIITDFYHWCRGRDLYLNVPDNYFLAGSNKTGMGYRETDWSLPRDRQIILGRQNIYDGTWDKTPSMGWMFVPLVQYHGGGAAATLEPLREHLKAYGADLAYDFGAGVQACYRGPRLYDSPETERLVKTWVRWFKRYRAILESDIIHFRRADGRHIDGILHVNPRLENKGLAMLFNPLNHPVTRTLTLPLYYAGLTTEAWIRRENGQWKHYSLDREYRVHVPVTIPADTNLWLLIRSKSG